MGMILHHGIGHIADNKDPRDLLTPDLVRALHWGPADASSDLTSYIDEMWDQEMSESCVGQAIARAAHVRGLLMGYTNMKRPSRLAPYTLARMYEKALASPLRDSGCMPRNAARATYEWGLAPDEAWPFDMRYVNITPTPDVLRAAADYRVDAFYAIDDLGTARAELVREALTAGIPVCVAFLVDQTFNDFTGSHVMSDFDGTIRGGHYVCVLGHRPDGSFLVCNSWGSNWGFGGLAFVSEARLCHITTTDVRALTIAPDIE